MIPDWLGAGGGGGRGQPGVVMGGAVAVAGEEGGHVGHGAVYQGAAGSAVIGGGQRDDHVVRVPYVEGVAVGQLQYRLGGAGGAVLQLHLLLLLLLLASGAQDALCRTHRAYYDGMDPGVQDPKGPQGPRSCTPGS